MWLPLLKCWGCLPGCFAGHVGPIRQLMFSVDQSVLCSAGEDGHVYAFNLLSSPASRIEDAGHVLKTCRFTTVMVTSNKGTVISAGGVCSPRRLAAQVCTLPFPTAYAHAALLVPPCHQVPVAVVASAGKDASGMNIIQVVSRSDISTFNTLGCRIMKVVLDPAEKVLYCGTDSGSVRVYKWPLQATTSHAGGDKMGRSKCLSSPHTHTHSHTLTHTPHIQAPVVPPPTPTTIRTLVPSCAMPTCAGDRGVLSRM